MSIYLLNTFYDIGYERPGKLERGDTFIQDFTCTWFPKHGKEQGKKLWPQKDPDERCKFWEERASD